MSWISTTWDWYATPDNREALKPLLTLFGSLIVGVGTIAVGFLVARAALRQARTAIEQAKTATEIAQTASRQADIASRRHDEQTRADRARRVTDTFSKAVEQLGSEKMEVRVGGIYTLERLASEALTTPQATDATGDESTALVSDLYWTVMETLTAFVRERARWQEPKAAPGDMTAQSDLWQTGARSGAPRPTPPTDIAAVLEVIRRRPAAGREREERRGWRFDLNTTDLRGANLLGAHLDGADLEGAHLEGANLWGAHLDGANLEVAHLEGASLAGAHLQKTQLFGAHLEGASLAGAHLKDAVLWEAYLEGAYLMEADLTGVDLEGTFGDARTQLPKGVVWPADWPV
jgi:hypothetical protein